MLLQSLACVLFLQTSIVPPNVVPKLGVNDAVPKKINAKSNYDFWLSLDVGLDLWSGLYPSVGVSVPLGNVYLSTGVWAGWPWNNAMDFRKGISKTFYKGLYVTVGYSITILD